jgi:hypothetical protein
MDKQREPLTRKERINRNILIGCGVAGGLIGAALIANAGHIQGASNVLNAPMSAPLALGLVFVWTVLLPIVAVYWHRIIDEQEASAFKDGALWSGYAFIIGAPAWWALAKAGLVAAPDAMICVAVVSYIWSGVWLWKKYR